nr:uncharacterized protein LOC111420665 [Onthophagus taurus]
MSNCSSAKDNSKIFDLLNEASKQLNITNPKFDVSSTNKKGDGYMSVIYNATITSTNEDERNEKNKKVSVIVKLSPENKSFREQAFTKELFENEIMFYHEILTSFHEFQKSKSIEKPFIFAPKCYASTMMNEREGLVLENLKVKGFQLWNRMIPMDRNHLEITLKGYAKFHALSIAFKDQHKEKFLEYKTRMHDVFELYDRNSVSKESFQKMAEGVTSYFDPIKDKKYLEKFVNYLQSMKDTSGLFYSKNMDEYGVVIHGDGWCNNMMYKYEDSTNNSKPLDICFLDFQIINYNTPIHDFTHFFYTSSSKEDQDNLEHYINMYYETLSDFIKKLGSDPEKTYPKSVFNAHWKKYCSNGINVAMFMIKMMTSESDEVPDFAKTSEKESILDALSYEPKNTDYKKRVRDIIVHFCDRGFI